MRTLFSMSLRWTRSCPRTGGVLYADCEYTAAMAGKYELFKTSSHFDSTAKHPDWLGGDTPALQQLAPPSA